MKRGKGPTWIGLITSHKSVPVPRRQRAVAVRMGMCGLDDRSACRRLDERRCIISLHLRRDGVHTLPFGPLKTDLDLDLLLLDRGVGARSPVDDNGLGFSLVRMQSC